MSIDIKLLFLGTYLSDAGISVFPAGNAVPGLASGATEEMPR